MHRVRGRPFKPGNPGRPPGSKNKTTQTLEQLAEGQAELLYQKILGQALAGDVSCQRLLLDRIWPPRKSRALYYDNWREKMAFIQSLLRKNAPDLPVEGLRVYLNSKPQGPYKLATILSQETERLLSMDRYERRALSRRKFAVRAFDEARRRGSRDCNN
jgi:hypothetical protein